MSRPHRGEQMILNIARMRYEDGLTQSEIAEEVGVSVATVSRHLKQAMDLGIVEIRVSARAFRNFDLERKLVRMFKLESAIVVASQKTPASTLRVLGKASNVALSEYLTTGAIIGVSNGLTVAAVAENMRRLRASELNVLTLIGGVGMAEEPSQTGQICRTLASRIGGKAWILPLPAVVESGEIASAFRNTQAYAEVFSQVDKMSVALIGIGAMTKDSSTLTHGHFSRELLSEVIENKAVGTICARFFDKDGRVIPTDIDARTISVSLEKLSTVPVKFGVAIGEEKAQAIKAAIRGGLINVLGTDTDTAEALLAD
ncbi:sugar-binding transcriptional regulator [Boseongicola aestuarii]|uniref:Sorbitol operon regulator n=1 Tax=Boseongicola aestuarii TaxID=1470561 RepID=A0A238IY06_9RHOB|nr:sugar-binding transcriptional regulator [Boseongicola aestuarii]SMX23358.1 Sorbitol operon regulator [Boseongicola aestuarii]